MIASTIVGLCLLQYSGAQAFGESPPDDDCQDSMQELPNGYCPSPCEVQEEMIRFHHEMEEYLTQQDVFLQEVKDGILHMNANYHGPSADTIISDIEAQGLMLTTMAQLQNDVTSQQDLSLSLRQNISILKDELSGLMLELETVQDQCESFCSRNDEDDAGLQRFRSTNDMSNADCGDDDTLCLNGPDTMSVTIVREDGIICPQFDTAPAKDCAELYNLGHRDSGIYRITPTRPVRSFYVYCDMQDSGGGWTVIQRRNDGSVNFNRTWQEYANGFGTVSCSKEFWIGNNNLKEIGETGFQTARFVMTDWENETRVAQYSYFKVNSEHHLYTLQLSYYQPSESNCSDSMIMSGAPNAKFSTRDRRSSHHLSSCERSYDGWWGNSCQRANLNGLYHNGTYDSRTQPTGIIWPSWKGADYSMQATQIKLRPYDFSGNS